MPFTDPVEPDDAGDEEGVPSELTELHEVLEYAAAVAKGAPS